MTGLGFIPPRVAVLTWPRTLWGPTAAQARRLPPALREALEAVEASQPLCVQLTPGPGRNRSETEVDLYLFPYQHAWRGISPEQAADLLKDAAQDQPRALASGTPFTSTLVLCCTDSKVDACCAKYGRATTQALAEAAQDYPEIDVWETSHVGGCRFAASCLVLPQRALYSRVEPADAPGFIETLAAGRIYAPCYRGHPELDGIDQVAHAAGLMWAHRQGLSADVHIVDRRQQDADRIQFQVAVEQPRVGRHWQLHITCTQQAFVIYTNCQQRKNGEAYPFPRWLATDIELIAS